LALLPGSRTSEIKRHLPTMLTAAQLIQQAIPETQLLLPLASTAPRDLVEGMVAVGGGPGSPAPCPPPTPPTQPFEGLGVGMWGRGKGPAAPCPLPHLIILPGQAYAALRAAHVAVVASGTATLEAALAGCPSVVVYRLAPATYEVGKRLIRVDFISMANLLAGEGIFPELIQDDFTPERLAREVLDFIRDPTRLAALRRSLARVVASLGPPGASARAAEVALKLLGGAGQSFPPGGQNPSRQRKSI
ncbi:MAG: hypothetical protein JRI59_05820, partial [Deltaproteobacteria bacterium]|nr:hypothetical protein [Deltaproteobacteria bacterium]